MKYLLLVLVSLLTGIGPARSQDGKILERQPYVFADSTLARISKVNHAAGEVVRDVDFYRITYLSDGLKVSGYLAMPKKQGKYPCVIFNRGGNRDFGALNPGSLIRLIGEVATWGYVVAASQYRGNGGGEGREEFGGSDVNDVLNLVPVLAQVGQADTSRIGMFGWSRGGMMTYLALARTNRMKAAVIGSGMADALMNTRKRPEMDSVFQQLAPGYGKNRDSVLKARSAVYWADKICKTTPLLILTGSADWRVSPDEQLEMVHRLYEIRHPVRFAMFEGGQHSLAEHHEEVDHAIRVFLDAYVRDGKTWPSLEPHGR
jgi:dipeptidyl aminopeptidase/acylaminoacyl peptidase